KRGFGGYPTPITKLPSAANQRWTCSQPTVATDSRLVDCGISHRRSSQATQRGPEPGPGHDSGGIEFQSASGLQQRRLRTDAAYGEDSKVVAGKQRLRSAAECGRRRAAPEDAAEQLWWRYRVITGSLQRGRDCGTTSPGSSTVCGDAGLCETYHC